MFVSRRRWPWAAAAALAVVVLGPVLLGSGYTLRGDMIFVPDQPWKAAWLGLDGSVPRAVPMDAFVSLATYVVPGWVVQRTLLLAILVLGAVGADRMIRLGDLEWPWFARLGAMMLFVWNPWVAERLLIGQWAIVGGYATLPWVVAAAHRARDDLRGGWPGLAATLLVAGVCSPSSGVTAAGVALAVVSGRPAVRSLAAVLGLATIANLPWLVPALRVEGGIAAEAGFAAFSARAESALGLLPSLVSTGGIWKTSIVPEERTIAYIVAMSVLVSAFAVVGLLLPAQRRRLDHRLIGSLGAIAVVGILVAWLPSWAPVADGLDSASSRVPGLAMLRDGHRYVGPAVLVLLPGLAAGLTWLAARARPGWESVRVVVAAVVLAPVVLLPSLAWGAFGRLEPVHYPEEWSEVADLLAAQPDLDEASTVVLPWTGSYRRFAWNDDRAQLDPAPRFLPGDVLIDDRVFLGSSAGAQVLPSETSRLRAVGAALDADPDAAAAELRSLGVRWVLVERGMPSDPPPRGTVLHAGPGLTLVDLGAARPRDAGGLDAVVLTGNVLATILAIVVAWVTQRRRKMYGARGTETRSEKRNRFGEGSN